MAPRYGLAISVLLAATAVAGCGDAQSVAPRSTPALKQVEWMGMRLSIPEGWNLRADGEGFACFQAPGKGDCAKGNEVLRVSLVGGEYSAWPSERLDERTGWAAGDPPYCMAAGSKETDFADHGGARIAAKETVTLADGRKAAYREWAVPCQNGSKFSTKVWYVADVRVAFYTLDADPALGAIQKAIVASADMRRFKR
ncbi:hypothetical protein [Actinomadura sp. 9N407]|uniref:hypothetical protein n=1 Tax=Actinomadura sp. 9N407 TaxID=3375154 RepID=UPI003799EADE